METTETKEPVELATTVVTETTVEITMYKETGLFTGRVTTYLYVGCARIPNIGRWGFEHPTLGSFRFDVASNGTYILRHPDASKKPINLGKTGGKIDLTNWVKLPRK